MRVPEDAAVIGCDNIPLAQFSIPALTTIGFENQQLLDVLTKNILAASHGEPIQELPSPHLSIVIRQSA